MVTLVYKMITHILLAVASLLVSALATDGFAVDSIDIPIDHPRKPDAMPDNLPFDLPNRQPHPGNQPPKGLPSKEQFDFPEEISQVSAVFRFEMASNLTKTLYYHINENTTNCKMQLNFYISEVRNSGEGPHTASIKVYNPAGLLVDSFAYKSNAKKFRQHSLKLDSTGKYRFLVHNKNEEEVVMDLVLGLTNCYYLKHRLHKQDFVTFTNRFNMEAIRQTVN
jgi:hypothetical protein